MQIRIIQCETSLKNVGAARQLNAMSNENYTQSSDMATFLA